MISKKTKMYLFVIFISFLQTTIYAETVGILFNDRIPVYQKIASNFKKSIISAGHDAKIIKYTPKDENAVFNEIKSKGVTHMFSIGAPASKICDKAGYPGVFTMVVDPIKTGFIDKNGSSLGQMTGVLVNISPRTQFSYIKKILGEGKKAGVIYNPEISEFVVKEYEKQSAQHGLTIIKVPVYSKDQVPPAVEGLKRRVDCILSVVDTTAYSVSSIQVILRFSLMNKVPVFGFSPQQVKAGALMGFYCDYPKLGVQAAKLMDTLIVSGDVTTVFVELPEDTEYAINTQTEDIMKLKIPSDIKSNASQIFGD